MKKLVAATALAATLTLTTPLAASAAPTEPSLSAQDATTNAALIEKANRTPLVPDLKAASRGVQFAPQGTYPTRKGVILVTPDAFKGLIPTGHAAIIYSSNRVVESLSGGVTTGYNNWNTSKKQAYGVAARRTTAAQDATAANWAYAQIGKPYNWNYLNTGTRSSFYCSHLIWASFKDNFGINMNTSAWLNAVHPMELVDTSETNLTWRKA